MTKDKKFDAAVIGLGAAGCWAAKVLTERGLDVIALDAGGKLSEADLPRQVRPATYFRTDLVGRKWIQSRSISYHPDVKHLYVDDWGQPLPYARRRSFPVDSR